MGTIEHAVTKDKGQDAPLPNGARAKTSEKVVAARPPERETAPARHAANNQELMLDTGSARVVRLDPAVLKANRIVANSDAPAAMSYKMLRTRVLQRMRSNGWTTLAVTGTCPDEGKTLTAINLSFSMARDVNASVVLVDLDLRQPSIAQALGVSPNFGLNDCLEGDVSPQRAAVRPAGLKRLAMLLNQKAYSDSSEKLSSPEMHDLVDGLRQGPGRIVVFDLPPILATDDMLAFTPLVDTTLMVVSEGVTRQDDLVAARQLLEDANVVGTVLNRSSDDQKSYYHYGYGSY
jgi:protein-tyrosine kinase